MIGQKVDSVEHSIYFISKNLQGVEFKYIVIEKELLVVIYALNKFRHYIIRYEIFVHTDHSTIKNMMNKPTISGRLARWFLLMQEFDITILDKANKANVVAKFLSQLHVPDDPASIDDSFPDEHIFLLLAQNPGYANIMSYLTTRKMPVNFSAKERKSPVENSFNYSLISGFIFYTGPDQVMCRCIREDETYHILRACHDEPCQGHFAANDSL